ncbi:response regulator [Caballeronia cordobensis]|uniref:response regulator n=1 Tax=Caballeronia cordobensis TaxID=1353886 RepID=UPI00045EE462|nr:response regulator receiver protein [Burkholderia sp. RPE67]
MASVLLVDDDIGWLGSLGVAIAAEGHIVRTATDGEHALLLVKSSPPDIVVTDCAMPGLDGVRLIRSMLADPNLAQIPVILMSDARRRPNVPCVCFMSKPFAVLALLRQLKLVERCVFRRT